VSPLPGGRRELAPQERLSAQSIEFIQRHVELSKSLEEQRRTDFASAMKWKGNGPTIAVRPSRAVALGMHDFGRVLRKRLLAVLVLLGDQGEYLLEFSQGRRDRGETCAASGGLRSGDPDGRSH